MSIFKSKKIIATTLTFVMVMTLTGLPLPAKERRGATVVVTMTDGHMVKGELLAVKADALLIYDQNGRQGKSLDLQQVVQVKVINKMNFGDGLLIGMGIGVGISLFAPISIGQKLKYDEKLLCSLITIVPIAGLIGGFSGALAGINKKFSLDGISSYDMQQNLERLKRYAREQEFEKSAAE